MESLFSVQDIIVGGKILLFTMGVHCEAKKLFKKFAFSLKFVITLLSVIIRGVNQSEYTLYSCLNVKEVFARNRWNI